MAIKSAHLAGFLIQSDVALDLRHSLANSPQVSSLNRRTLWFSHYVYETRYRIPKVDDPLAQPPFQHEILVCAVSEGILALGVRHDVIGHLLEWELSNRLHLPWRRAKIDVQEVIRARMEYDPGEPTTPAPPLSEYDVSQITAQTESFRGFVRKIKLWGDNVMHAPLFRDHATNLECTSCTLKRENNEIVTIGSDGFLSFYLPKEGPGQTSRLREVMAILKILHDTGLLSF